MSYWLWFAWTVFPGGRTVPLYGMICETNWSRPLDAAVQEIALPSGAKLNIQERLIDRADADHIQACLKVGTSLDLTHCFPKAPLIPVTYLRNVLVPAFGREVAYSRCAYGLLDPASLFATSDDAASALKAVHEILGFDFEKKLITHLGGFDYFSLGAWLEGPASYSFETLKDPGDAMPRTGQLRRLTNTDRDQTAQLSIISDGEMTLDRLIALPAGIGTVTLELQPFLMDGYFLRIYGGDESVLEYQEQAHFIREIGGSLATVERTVNLSDSLSRKGQSHGAQAAVKTQSATAIRNTPIAAEYDPTKLRGYRRSITQAVGAAVAPQTGDRWFPKTFESEVGVIDYLNALLAKPTVCEAILVDPFLGEDGFERTLMRFTQTNLTLTIVTSWGRTDPDTGEEITKYPEEIEHKSIAALSAVLNKAGAHIAPTLRVVNLTTAAGRQAFHDRYVLIEHQDGELDVYLLSNSLNAMALHWPFCVAELKGRAKFEAASYIRGLANGQDLASGAPPKVTFRWPTTQPPGT